MLKYCFNNFRCNMGQNKYGVQFGGDSIIKLFPGSNVKDININNLTDYREGYRQVNKNLKNNIFNINLGGDHSIAVSTIQPLLDFYRKDLLVIWIDAHGDINTFNTSLTQNIHGMPLGALTGLMNHWYPVKQSRFILPFNNLLYVGVRELDPIESIIVKDKKILNYPNYQENIIDIIQNHPAKYIHISCDIDGLDPINMPSTGTIVPNGLSVSDVTTIIRASKDRLVSFDLVEFNPHIGNYRAVYKTLLNIYSILSSVIAHRDDFRDYFMRDYL